MNATELLAELRERDVRLWIEGEALRYRGPEDELGDDVLAKMKASKAELFTLLAASSESLQVLEAPSPSTCSIPPSAGEPQAQVLAASGAQMEEVAEVDVGALLGTPLSPVREVEEILRPDLRAAASHLAALDEAPVEAAPSPGCVWVRDLGVWQGAGGGCVPTAATRAAYWRYRAARRAAESLATQSRSPSPPRTTWGGDYFPVNTSRLHSPHRG